jgi:hypothetical protein
MLQVVILAISLISDASKHLWYKEVFFRPVVWEILHRLVVDGHLPPNGINFFSMITT